jgi:hypothetical protein
MAPSPGTPPVPVPPAGLEPDTSPPPGSVPPCPPRPVLPLEVSGVTGDEPAASVPLLLEAPLRDGCLTCGAELPGSLEPGDVAPGALDWAKADVDSKMPRGSTAKVLSRIVTILSVLSSKPNLIQGQHQPNAGRGTPPSSRRRSRTHGIGWPAGRPRGAKCWNSKAG